MSEEKKIWYYAQINTDSKLCCGVSQLYDEKIQDDMIEIGSYDTSLIGKMWTGTWNEGTQSWDGGEWVGNPNPPGPEPETETVTLEILQAKIDQLEQQNMALMMGMVDVYSAVTTGKGE